MLRRTPAALLTILVLPAWFVVARGLLLQVNSGAGDQHGYVPLPDDGRPEESCPSRTVQYVASVCSVKCYGITMVALIGGPLALALAGAGRCMKVMGRNPWCSGEAIDLANAPGQFQDIGGQDRDTLLGQVLANFLTEEVSDEQRWTNGQAWLKYAEEREEAVDATNTNGRMRWLRRSVSKRREQKILEHVKDLLQQSPIGMQIQVQMPPTPRSEEFQVGIHERARAGNLHPYNELCMILPIYNIHLNNKQVHFSQQRIQFPGCPGSRIHAPDCTCEPQSERSRRFCVPNRKCTGNHVQFPSAREWRSRGDAGFRLAHGIGAAIFSLRLRSGIYERVFSVVDHVVALLQC